MNLEKGEYDKLVESSGGINNGSTRFDFTNYYSIIPSHKIETMLWAEADKMKGLEINQVNLTNQQEVVKNEVLVNVINQPYGGFPWLDMPQIANENWYNAHNFYGDLSDLDSAKLEDVAQFFNTFYAPNNAVISIVGDMDIEETKGWIKKYFGSIPAVTLPPKPDLSEPRQEKEKVHKKEDKLISKPAIAFAYKMPDRNTPEYYAMGLIDQILVQGQDSRLYRKLVKEKGFTGYVSGGINYLGHMFNYNGPMLWMFNLTYDMSVNHDSITTQVNNSIRQLENEINQEMIDRAIIKLRSNFYDIVGDNFGRADMLACFALFDDDPARINNIEKEFKKITPQLIRKTVQEYLRETNRTILIVEPSKK
jgi:predicted Zn-dependent peptidase